MNGKTIFIFCLAAILAVGFSDCSSKGQSGENQGQQQQAEDQQTRQKVAEATQKAKEASKVVAEKADQAAKDLAHKAEVVKQGVKEGWAGDSSQPIDLNSTSAEDLQKLPGISQEDAEKIIRGRPYTNENELLNKKIISNAEFQRIEGRITVK
jgi:DNA uptake protein ComE-like DNA-binding protein